MYEGEIVNRLDGTTAPSNALEVDGVILDAMIESSGKDKPRTPLNNEVNGSESTEVAAAEQQSVSP